MIDIRVKISKKLLLTITRLFFSLTFTILLPLLIYAVLKSGVLIEQTGFENYLKRWDFLITPLVIIGCINAGFLLITRSQDKYRLQCLFYSITAQFVYIVQIIIWSNLLVINFVFNGYVIVLDLSLLYALITILPFLLIIRNLLIFHTRRKDFLYKIIVLKAIYALKRAKTKTHIRRYISNKLILEKEVKMLVLRNFSIILSSLQEGAQPLIKKRDKYYLTKHGSSALRYYETSLIKRKNQKDLKVFKDKEIDAANLEVWTEEELEKLKQSCVI